MSISAGLLVIAIVIIRSVALNRLPKTMFLILWGITLCRLLIPFSFPLPFSVYSIIGKVLKPISHGITIAPVIDVILPTGSPTIGTTGQALQAVKAQVFTIAPTTVIWLIGMLAVFIFFTVVHFKNHGELRFALPIRDNDFLNEWLAEHNILRAITIMQSDRITTPVAVGVVKPRIILPKSMNIGDKQLLRYVLTHESYHIRRFDALWKLLLTVALCVHWFNPLVWVMFILVNRDLEITCDEMVVRHFGADTKTAYAYSLIGMAEQRRKFAPLYSGFSKNAAEERITSIMKYKKASMLAITLAVILVAGIASAFAATASDTTNDVIPETLSAAYDEDGNLIYFQALDENGNIVYLDYEPESEKGDVQVNGYEDVLDFFSKTIPCVNGVSEAHKISNGEMAVYTNDGGAWTLKSGQAVKLTFDVTDEDWWGVWIGYYKDGEYIRYGYDPELVEDQRYILSGETTIEFIAPEDGDYCFFMVNMSAASVYVNRCTIAV